MSIPEQFGKTASNAIAGKDILLSIYSKDGTEMLAISGQQGLTINRSAESMDVTSKDTQGGYRSKIAGIKEWSIDTDGLYVPSDKSHKLLAKAFEDGDAVACKVINNKTGKDMFGGYASITDYSFEAPYDDGMTYSIALEGAGPFVDLDEDVVAPASASFSAEPMATKTTKA